jgi:DNA-binding transcriptional MerR regulator
LGKKRSGPVPAQDSVAEHPVKIGEAAKLVGVEPYVLRFWETQFPFIRPRQSRSRHRSYTPADIETLKTIKHLLHTEGYTIAGARKFVREKGLDGIKTSAPSGRAASGRKTKEKAGPAPSSDALVKLANNGFHRTLREIREDLRALHKLLETD